MTVLFGAHAHLYKFQFVASKNDTERVREGTITHIQRTTWPPALRAKFQFDFPFQKTRHALSLFQRVKIAFHIKGLQLFVFAQIQRMMGMALFADGAGTVPPGAVFLAHRKKIPDTFG